MTFVERKRKANRLSGYDYSTPSAYFVTVCTMSRVSYFGEIVDGQMTINESGSLAIQFWCEIPRHYLNVDVDEFQIMPNHMHGIIILKELSIVGTAHCAVREPNQNSGQTVKAGNLSRIVKSYKNAASKAIKEKLPNSNFEWQRSFYDHIIRSEESLNDIRRYIRENPMKWELDKYYSHQ